MQINSNHKATKYKTLITDLHSTYPDIKFVSLSMSALGILGCSSDSLLSMFKDFNFDQNHQNYIIKKVVSIALGAHATYSVGGLNRSLIRKY